MNVNTIITTLVKQSMKEALDGDPGGPIQIEVERGIAGMIDQHTTWLELLSSGQRGEEFDWRTAELLSCSRSIEWDLQDLEDAVSIVEGNRKKFGEIDDGALKSRKDFIDAIRSKIDYIRKSVQEAQSNPEGFVTKKKGLAAKIASVSVAQGYGKLPKEQAQDGASCAGTSAPTAIGSNLTTFSSSPGGSRVGNTESASDEDPRRRRRRWYAWCC